MKTILIPTEDHNAMGAVLEGARAMALTAIDLCLRPELRETITNERLEN